MERRLEASLRKATRFLEENRYRYALVGGLALPRWGVVRATYDIDIKVLVPEGNYDAVEDALRAAFPASARAVGPADPLIVPVDIDGVTVDFLLALPGYEHLIIDRATPFDLDRFRVWVCSAEDLIIQKAVAGRAKDWMDAEALQIEQHGRLDQEYIEEWLAQFAEALDKPELIRDYRDLRRKTDPPSGGGK